MDKIKIVLVHSPHFHQQFMENLEFVSNNFGKFPPLGLMYVSSILKSHGHDVIIIDSNVEGLSKKETVSRIKEFNPNLVGFMLTIFMGGETLKWARYVKEKTGLPIIVGNYAMVHYPESIISNDFVDYGIIGSARESLPRLIDSLENNNDIKNIEGIAFKDSDGKLIINMPKDITEDLNKLPFPDRDSIDNSKYYSMASKKKPFTIMTTSYGCPFNCDFCDMGRFGYRERDVGQVVDEIEICVKKYGIKEIDIFDRDFLINKERSRKICEKIIERGIEVDWSCRTRVDQVDEDILKLMKDAGCRLILYGIESGDQKILDNEHKGIKLSQIKNSIQITKDIGIETLGFIIIGHPGDTIETIRKTINFSKELPLDYVQFFKMSGKPGAKLYDQIVDEMGYDYFEKFLRLDIDERDLPRPWTDLSSEEIEKWVSRAYVEFYMRPKYLFKRLVNVRSPNEFLKYLRVGAEMLYSI